MFPAGSHDGKVLPRAKSFRTSCKSEKKVSKIEQIARALGVQSCAKLPLRVSGEAIALDVIWNEQLVGSEAP